MKMRAWVFLLLMAVAGTAGAQSAREMRQQVEASMLVTGHVDIEADGTVSAHVIDERDRLPDYVVALVDEAARGWRFEPVLVDGEPVLARAKMSLRVLARLIEGGDFVLSIGSGTFGEYSDEVTDWITRRKMDPPRYPTDMLMSGAQGTVYLLLKVARDGTVEDVVAERVNLRTSGTERQMERMRRAFADTSVAAARRWRYNPPTTGDRVDEEYWVTRVPVEFTLETGRRSTAGAGRATSPARASRSPTGPRSGTAAAMPWRPAAWPWSATSSASSPR